ncbi:putative ADP-ribosylation factor GTPase-activating protein AGD11 [Hordeum vulgare]|nr:putative ADP-ribosylation factor GTPase-activating protein AGD11 [Hordeum vulgare]
MQEVFDEDKFTADDSIGMAEFNVTDIYDAAKLDPKHASDGTRIKTIYPVGTNYLGVALSCYSWNGFTSLVLPCRLYGWFPFLVSDVLAICGCCGLQCMWCVFVTDFSLMYALHFSTVVVKFVLQVEQIRDTVCG